MWSRKKKENMWKIYNLLWTTRLAVFSSFPSILRASHLYSPASSKPTLVICIRPFDATLVRLLGNDPLVFDHDIWTAGFPEAEHRSEAVLVSLTISFGAEIVTFGGERDSPGSPLIPGIPGIPGGPISPLIPFSPLTPDGPIFPGFPLRPGAPIIPRGPLVPLSPLGPALPGSPGRPRGQTFNCPWYWHSFKVEEIMSPNSSLIWAELLKGDGCEILRFTRWGSSSPCVVETRILSRNLTRLQCSAICIFVATPFFYCCCFCCTFCCAWWI